MDNFALTKNYICFNIITELLLTLIKTHMHTPSVPQKKGFTLLEILLVVAAIGILASIVLVAINPNRQLSQARNAQRRSNVTTISNAIYQKIIDDAANNVTTMNTALVDGTVYALGTGTTAQCGPSGTTLVVPGTTASLDLTAQLIPDYIAGMPVDPNGGSAACTGYTITQVATEGRITITAPFTELGVTLISVTR